MQIRENWQKHILVIDDQPDILDLLYDFLELEGYRVQTTTRGDFLETLPHGEGPDLILLDVFLSGRDGCEMLRLLKRRASTSQIPVIMFSAHPSAEAMAREAGADEFLEKPFDMELLVTIIARFLMRV
ncbi:MAG TPA: response regulator [Ktedonobacteraceae bacterium]|nr:response regulator [Ktedonobacteraceae bacterium]